MAEMTLDEMHEKKLASCPACSQLNSYAEIDFNGWTRCSKCDTAMILVKIDEMIMFMRNGWT